MQIIRISQMPFDLGAYQSYSHRKERFAMSRMPVFIDAEADILEGGQFRSMHATAPGLGIISGKTAKKFSENAAKILKKQALKGPFYVRFGQNEPYERFVVH